MTRRVDFDDFSESYNRLLGEKTRFFSSSESYFARYKVDLVRRNVHAPIGRLLEYGCGIGRNVPFLRQAFPEAAITGSDISGASLEMARRDNPGVAFVQEGPQAQCRGPFDLIFVAGVFHHVPITERLAVAKTLHERLAPGGLLFVFEQNPYNPVTRRIVRDCPYDEGAVLLTPGELRRILGEAALAIERRSYCLFVPPRLSGLARLEPLLGWLPLGGQYWVQAKRAQ